VQLILRLYQPTSGQIRYGAASLSNVDERILRTHVAVVEQQPVLFNMSFLDNIVFGFEPMNRWKSESAKLQAVQRAAKQAYAHDFIMDKGGYDSIVTERGANLSGGQRARVAIARVLLRDPAVILLDEATASLDGESETLVQRSLDQAITGRTAVIVAHRMATIRNADQILVMSRGKVRCSSLHAHTTWIVGTVRQGVWATRGTATVSSLSN
jgi:ABC-type multidrug transport system fused ATPase/permease subunit